MITNAHHHYILAGLASKIDSFLEIGVFEGDSAVAVAGANKSIKHITLVDPFTEYLSKTPSREMVRSRLWSTGFNGLLTTHIGLSRDELPFVYDRHDLVHVDGDHSYEGTLFDLRQAGRLANKFIVVHDVISIPEVHAAVVTYLKENSFKNCQLSVSDHGTYVFTL